MRKIATILTLAIFLISLMPFSIADHMDEDKSIEDSREDRLNRAEEQEKEKLKALEDEKEIKRKIENPEKEMPRKPEGRKD